ncbi:MAG: aspartate carbamoyltransferase [Calditrichae bacterium]|nr:aspartate carbamoyltransferase [Calditrichota bacterium]MCB9057329.1 aspartate carbamoyltransferase [Calditrichia bacterium]
MENLISMRDLDPKHILNLIDKAGKIEKKEIWPDMRGKVMASLFFEPSTRTQLSFDTAMKRLGGEVIQMSGTKGTSVEKGETLSDTVKIINQYSDIIVVRHPLEGAARYISEQVRIPVVNAGDGSNQHPSQSMLDLYSIFKTQGTLSGLTIALVGDLKYGRTVHSLVYALSSFAPKFYFISPELLSMPKYITEDLDKLNIRYEVLSNFEQVVPELDIMYVTRIQRERFADPQEYERVKNTYIIRAAQLKDVKSSFKILHPLPRVNEIHVDVDVLPSAYYFEQAGNGVYMRQSILSTLLGVE